MKLSNDYIIEQLIIDPNYKITEAGHVFVYQKKTDSWDLKDPMPDSFGYKRIKYNYKQVFVHRIVYRKFHGSLGINMKVNHKDGNPSNNNKDNLELVDHSGNMLHSYQVLKRKIVIGNFRINFKIAEQIRADKKDGKSFKYILDYYKLSKGHASAVLNYKIWKNDDIQPTTAQSYPSAERYIRATPSWVRVQDLKLFYKNTPKGFVVDHIIPLNHPKVSGLHCPSNLQYLKKHDNGTKNNQFDGTETNISWKINKNK